MGSYIIAFAAGAGILIYAVAVIAKRRRQNETLSYGGITVLDLPDYKPAPVVSVPSTKRAQPRKPNGQFDSYAPAKRNSQDDYVPPVVMPSYLETSPGIFSSPSYFDSSPSAGSVDCSPTVADFSWSDSGSSCGGSYDGFSGGDFGGGGAGGSW